MLCGQKSVQTTAVRSLKRLKLLYAFSRSAANIWDLHELNLARLGKELLDRLRDLKLHNDAANQVIIIIIIIIPWWYLWCCHHGVAPLREITWFIWWMQTERQVAANPQTKPIDLGCESLLTVSQVLTVLLITLHVVELTEQHIVSSHIRLCVCVCVCVSMHAITEPETCDVYRPSCVTVVCFVEENENAHSVHVMTKWWWKGVGVGEEELTRNYIKLVLAPQMGQGIIPNTVRESQEISFLKFSGTLTHSLTQSLTVGWVPDRRTRPQRAQSSSMVQCN